MMKLKKFFYPVFLASIAFLTIKYLKSVRKPMSKPVLFIVSSKGYQPIEYSVPKQMLEQAGITVVTGSDAGPIATSAEKPNEPGTAQTTEVNILLAEVNPKNYDGIVFIGGPGTMEHLDNETSYKITQEAKQNGIVLGAICLAPRVLAKAGVLRGKRATGWNGDNELPKIFEENNVIYKNDSVAVDGKIVTGRDPSSAQAFGEKLLEVL
ncbi:MAG: ThiJ/PfpI domain-containing protein [candidate division TM6 bacterium GW2011_GWF2_32_72]|nr:MAG: ThiJ/PfpI domain-containing protein [candidate division TM6 bacterium GW2011_GWF2_32_72]